MTVKFSMNMLKNLGFRKKSELWNLGSLIVPLTKNQFSGNKMCHAEDNNNYMGNMWEKKFRFEFKVKKLMAKYRFFQEIVNNFTYSQKS